MYIHMLKTKILAVLCNSEAINIIRTNKQKIYACKMVFIECSIVLTVLLSMF